ncbi:hypothetical protein [Streptomyces sp. NRRL S-920]|uniref:hypothetical protein n=1 Tax=Streptomyces sp. NRRL S-920 TaxID=1463921 RepID=UPI00131C1860|nr:hypothetical protein [Streptomyces sp. NRRL S-920]
MPTGQPTTARHIPARWQTTTRPHITTRPHATAPGAPGAVRPIHRRKEHTP